MANAMSEVPLESECSGCGSYKLERYSAGKRSMAMAAAAVPAEARRQRGRTSRSVSPCSRLAMTTILRNRDGAVKQHVPIFDENKWGEGAGSERDPIAAATGQ